MTLKQKLGALKIIEEVHRLNHAATDISQYRTSQCGCAFGIVWRMINETPLELSRKAIKENRAAAKAWKAYPPAVSASRREA